ncbi:MAG: hypothetical protein JO001_13185 [Alphaproteobacteria bacterium]|nr:hypothetical protein [Alphaproteobacteria bacterium]
MTYTTNPRSIPVSLLQTVFTSQHLPGLFGGYTTHDSALRFIAQAVRYTQDAKYLTTIVAAALPEDYGGNTLAEVPAIIQSALDKGFGEVSERKESSKKPNSPIEIAKEAALELFHDTLRRPFMRVQLEGGERIIAIKSALAQGWLRHLIYQANKKSLPNSTMTDTLETLAAMAIFNGPQKDVCMRIGGEPGRVIIDRGTDTGGAIEITPDGYRAIGRPDIPFWRSPGFGELPEPATGGDINELRTLLNLEETEWYCLLGFLLGALRWAGPFLCLLAEGEQGSGKSFLCDVVKRLLDPHQGSKLRLPRADRDLMIQAYNQHVLIYDNSSGMPGDISDALCSLATGGGYATRRLYTDDEQQVFALCRPFVINGIADFVNRPDLLERAILVHLPPIPEGARKTEAEMNAKFERIRPCVLGQLYAAVARALRDEEQTPAPADFRMADAARWITAAEPALGLEPGTIVGAIDTAQAMAMIERVQNHPLILRIERELDSRGPFDGTVGKLFDAVCVRGFALREQGLPATPAHLSRALKRYRPAAQKAGILIEFGDRHHEGKRIQIRRVEDKGRPASDWAERF